jgi:hypothetical protein
MQSIGSTGLGDDERLVVSPKRAQAMLDIGPTKLYELIAKKELDTYLEGSSRKITLDSIHRRVKRLLAQQAR